MMGLWISGQIEYYRVPEADDTLMMRPYFCWRITGQAALVTLYVPGCGVVGGWCDAHH